MNNGSEQAELQAPPKSWRGCDISDLCQFQRGFDLTEATRKPGGVPVYSSSGLSYFHNEPRLKPPAVITGRKGLLGRVFFVEVPCWPHDTTLWVKDFKGNDPRFVALFLGEFGLERFDAATSVPTLNRNNVIGVPIVLPPLAEQRAIAAALSEVDALLAALDRLIAKKRDLKQAAMQQLLTGQTRLPGFEGEWVVKRLGEVAETDPENLGSGTAPGYAFRYISLEDVDQGTLRSFTEQVFATAPSRARRKLRSNDVLVSTVRPNLLSHLLFQGTEQNWVCSTGFCVLRCRVGVSHAGYIFQHLFGAPVNRQIEALLTGSNYPSMNSRDVRALEIPFPPLPEQTAIAAVLSDMDAELAALEQRREKTRALKQGMMQELLTGRTRLV